MSDRKNGQSTTTTVHKDGKTKKETEGVEQEVVAAPFAAEGPMAKAKYGEGVTINMGNFQSYRVDVGIEMPCPPEKMSRAMAWCEDFVTKKLQAAVDKLDEKARTKLR